MITNIIVGLGNPGTQYSQTPHNLGFMVLDAFAQAHQLSWDIDKDTNSVVIRTPHLLLVKPQTFMNKSGDAVKKLVNYYKISPEHLLVVHDDADLPLGTMRVSSNRGAGGHHGVESLISALGTTKFSRLRLGIASNTKLPLDQYVLQPFSGENAILVAQFVSQAANAVQFYLQHGIEQTMNTINAEKSQAS